MPQISHAGAVVRVVEAVADARGAVLILSLRIPAKPSGLISPVGEVPQSS